MDTIGRILLAGAAFALAGCNQAPAPPPPDIAAERSAAVAAAVEAQRAAFAAAPDPAQADTSTAYQFAFDGLFTDRVPMTAFAGDVVMVVNTASRCGFTPQYEGLQQIYTEYRDRGFEIVGVPANNFMSQEPGSEQEIQQFCTLNYGVTFPMAAKTDVVGDERHPFYAWAETQLGEAAVPQWNFHKLLIGRDGRLIAAFPTRTEPTSEEVRRAIDAALAAPARATPTALN
ncbi:MAG TPA: glutathione peroxidase [Vitreimonas sp.]|uniref:glutathione peroxidase n=1 Tax=Vitreimonas sp. TaxID=3069702 RepID=UPI002D7557B0|nr:glutathione peroxidase [Vitreimonas sp.]HYD86322.1 glutathione peroxidase [Vitreimonas sp.]